jgi:hypothetical protein
MNNSFSKLLITKKSVFDYADISYLWGINNYAYLKKKINYWVNTNKLIRIKPGIFSLTTDYDVFELANKLSKPSYISFETILRQAGCVFQFSKDIVSASQIAKEIKIADRSFLFRELKNTALLNIKGLINKDTYWHATVERAFLDMLYLNKDYYFDNLLPLNWDKVFDIIDIYENKQLIIRTNKYWNSYAKKK